MALEVAASLAWLRWRRRCSGFRLFRLKWFFATRAGASAWFWPTRIVALPRLARTLSQCPRDAYTAAYMISAGSVSLSISLAIVAGAAIASWPTLTILPIAVIAGAARFALVFSSRVLPGPPASRWPRDNCRSHLLLVAPVAILALAHLD